MSVTAMLRQLIDFLTFPQFLLFDILLPLSFIQNHPRTCAESGDNEPGTAFRDAALFLSLFQFRGNTPFLRAKSAASKLRGLIFEARELPEKG
jgi:hypothetical protein